jgi:hypothetical protein
MDSTPIRMRIPCEPVTRGAAVAWSAVSLGAGVVGYALHDDPVITAADRPGVEAIYTLAGTATHALPPELEANMRHDFRSGSRFMFIR